MAVLDPIRVEILNMDKETVCLPYHVFCFLFFSVHTHNIVCFKTIINTSVTKPALRIQYNNENFFKFFFITPTTRLMLKYPTFRMIPNRESILCLSPTSFTSSVKTSANPLARITNDWPGTKRSA